MIWHEINGIKQETQRDGSFRFLSQNSSSYKFHLRLCCVRACRFTS